MPQLPLPPNLQTSWDRTIASGEKRSAGSRTRRISVPSLSFSSSSSFFSSFSSFASSSSSFSYPAPSFRRLLLALMCTADHCAPPSCDNFETWDSACMVGTSRIIDRLSVPSIHLQRPKTQSAHNRRTNQIARHEQHPMRIPMFALLVTHCENPHG